MSQPANYEYKLVHDKHNGHPFRKYKKEDGGFSELESEINQLAEDGWEVISTAGITKGATIMGTGASIAVPVITLRRLKST